MIQRLTPQQFDRASETGRTRPGFIVCENAQGDDIEVVVKLSAGCDLRETSLALELFAACLAGGLGLPVPEPFIVDLTPDWLALLHGTDWGRLASSGSSAAFGSRRLPPAYRTWIAQTPLVGGMVATAAAAILFDAITDNPDRRDSNPNCLIRGDDIRLIDHELALSPVPLLGWRPPWTCGGMHNLSQPGAHIFFAPLRRQAVEWDQLAERWLNITEEDLAAYRGMIPVEWSSAFPAVDSAIEKIRNARDNIGGCIVEVQRLLT